MGDPDQDDDLATRQDLPELRRYDAGPPTIEERLSPFGSDSSESDSSMRSFPGTGLSSIPATAARIHMRDLGAPDGVTLPDGMASPFAMSSASSDGVTSPDGHAAMMPVTVVRPLHEAPAVVGPASAHPNASTQPQGSGWGREVVPPSFAAPPTFVAPTYNAPTFAAPPAYQAPAPIAITPATGFGAPPAAAPSFASPPPEVEVVRHSRPEVPAPDAPKVVVSPSLELAVADVRAMAPSPSAAILPPKVKRPPAAPTEVMLPALKRDQARKKESSDWPLIAGLVVLVLAILGLVVGVVIGVMRNDDVASQIPFLAPEPAPTAPAEPTPTATPDPASP